MLGLLGAISGPALAAFHTVDIAPVANGTLQSQLINGATYPTGTPTLLGGVPFDLPAPLTPYWNANNAVGANPLTLVIPVGLTGVTAVHTLINTFWGTTGASRASIEFVGSGGASMLVPLLGNDDIRDFNQNVFTNSINGTTTTNVFSNGSGQRLDKQVFNLPAAFLTESLTEIRLQDTGASGVQRVFLAGVTVQAVPLPPGIVLLATGLALLRRRRWRHSARRPSLQAASRAACTTQSRPASLAA